MVHIVMWTIPRSGSCGFIGLLSSYRLARPMSACRCPGFHSIIFLFSHLYNPADFTIINILNFQRYSFPPLWRANIIQRRLRFFEILGPTMVGPSSSHTAGAVRIGLVARKILGGAPVNADIGLHGSFAATGIGQVIAYRASIAGGERRMSGRDWQRQLHGCRRTGAA